MWNQGGMNAGDGGGYRADQAGGFLNNSGIGGGFGSPMQTSQPERKGKRAQELISCTVAQILQAAQHDDTFKVGEAELNMISVVGVIVGVQETPTHIHYRLDDRTGPILDVRHWVDNDDNTPDDQRNRPIPENTYVQVVGNLRSFGGKKNVGAFIVRPIVDLNEITHHMLDVIKSHMSLNKRATMEKNGGGAMEVVNAGQQAGYNQQPQHGYRAGFDSGGGGLNLGLNNVQKQVHQLISTCVDETGISIQSIQKQLNGIPSNQVRTAIEFLSNEGHVYSTIDDDHFKSTDS